MHLMFSDWNDYFVHNLGKKLYWHNVNMHLFPNTSVDILYVLKMLVKGRDIDVSNKLLYIQLHTDKASGPSLIMQVFLTWEIRKQVLDNQTSAYRSVWVRSALVVVSEFSFKNSKPCRNIRLQNPPQ